MVTGNAARGYPTQYGAPTDRQGGTAADASGPDRRATRDVEDFADALAAELDMEIAAMDPVNLTTGRVEHPRGAEGKPASYDAWDDEALDQFLDEYDLDGVDPVAIGAIEQQAEAEEEAAAQGRRWRVLAMAGLAVLVLAGAGYGAWTHFAPALGVGGIKLVKAPEGPFKVQPDPNDKTVTATSEGEAVFDSVGGAKAPTTAKAEERLVTRNDQVPELPAVKPQVSRVTLPDGKEVEAELPSGFDPADAGPRRVRTVLVRPDGTLIENPNSAPGASTAQTAPMPQDGPGQLIAQAEEADADSSVGLPPLAATEQTTPADTTPKSPITGAKTLTSVPANSLPAMAEAAAAPSPSTAPLPPSRPAAATTRPPQVTAPAASAPLDLAAAATQPAKLAPSAAPAAVDAPAVTTPPASGGSGGYVQLSSQRTEEAALAAYRALQKKFPSILGSMAPDVQKADLGAKGLYYRVRVGQPTRDKAAALCEQLRAAGGDCLLAK